MSVNGPDARYRPVRGTARAILLVVRRRGFEGEVLRLAESVGCTSRQVWLALASLADRRLVLASSVGEGVVKVIVTRRGRVVRL